MRNAKGAKSVKGLTGRERNLGIPWPWFAEGKPSSFRSLAKSRNGSGWEPIQPWNSSRTEGLQGSSNLSRVRTGEEQVEWLSTPPARVRSNACSLTARAKRSSVSVPHKISRNVANRRRSRGVLFSSACKPPRDRHAAFHISEKWSWTE